MLAAEVGGQRRFEVEADTVAAALKSLPVANLVFDERGALRQLVNVYVDGVDVRDSGGIDRPLAGNEEIRLIGAIAGGQPGGLDETSAVPPEARRSPPGYVPGRSRI
jgi:molybdopterin converting factor small subunit